MDWICGLLLVVVIPIWGGELVWKGDLPPPFEMTLQVNKERVALDETFQVRATFQYPPSYQVDEQAFIDQLIWSANPFAPQVALGEVGVHSFFGDAVQRLSLQATLYPMKEGELKLSFLTVAFEPKKEGDKVIRIQTPIFSLEVLPSSLDPSLLRLAPLAPLEPQFPLGLTEENRWLFLENPALIKEEIARNRALWQKKRLPWFILLLLACLGGLGGVIYWQRDRLFPPKPPSPWDPRQEAEAALKAVEKRQGDSQAVKNYYHALAALVYRLLQESKGLPRRAMTTIELGQSLASLSLSSETKEEILSFLLDTDRIRFAAEYASAGKIHAAYEQVLKLIGELYSGGSSL